MGDFNADPREPTYAGWAAGFRSSYADANGAEPAVTWPSGCGAGHGHRRRPRLPRLHLGPGDGARRRGARLAWDRPDPTDPTLYPSDHIGISAHLEIG